MNVLIIGAGSIGNHLAQAARRMNWNVTVTDTDPEALRRMREEIYPHRYGKWDTEISLLGVSDLDLKPGAFDIICIGTPPDTHLVLAHQALAARSKLLHIEKPLCAPSDDMKSFAEEAEKGGTMVTIGYDHAISPSFEHVIRHIQQKKFGEVISIDTGTREHWDPIFAVHPWLAGPHDSYLGYTKRGGGAACEHSHALHLAITIAQHAGWGTPLRGTCNLDMVQGPKGEHYDRLAQFTLYGSDGRLGRVVQDVITMPSRKWAEVFCEGQALRWECHPDVDLLIYPDGTKQEFPKQRPDDFFHLMTHYQKLLQGNIRYEDSPIRLETGLWVMDIIKTGL